MFSSHYSEILKAVFEKKKRYLKTHFETLLHSGPIVEQTRGFSKSRIKSYNFYRHEFSFFDSFHRKISYTP